MSNRKLLEYVFFSHEFINSLFRRKRKEKFRQIALSRHMTRKTEPVGRILQWRQFINKWHWLMVVRNLTSAEINFSISKNSLIFKILRLSLINYSIFPWHCFKMFPFPSLKSNWRICLLFITRKGPNEVSVLTCERQYLAKDFRLSQLFLLIKINLKKRKKRKI